MHQAWLEAMKLTALEEGVVLAWGWRIPVRLPWETGRHGKRTGNPPEGANQVFESAIRADLKRTFVPHPTLLNSPSPSQYPPVNPLYTPCKPPIYPLYINTGGLQGVYNGYTGGLLGDMERLTLRVGRIKVGRACSRADLSPPPEQRHCWP